MTFKLPPAECQVFGQDGRLLAADSEEAHIRPEGSRRPWRIRASGLCHGAPAGGNFFFSGGPAPLLASAPSCPGRGGSVPGERPQRTRSTRRRVPLAPLMSQRKPAASARDCVRLGARRAAAAAAAAAAVGSPLRTLAAGPSSTTLGGPSPVSPPPSPGQPSAWGIVGGSHSLWPAARCSPPPQGPCCTALAQSDPV